MILKNLTRAALFSATVFGLALGSAVPSSAEQDPPFCIQPAAPVCGVKGGLKFTYDNSCYAKKDGAKNISKGACKAPAKKTSKAKAGKAPKKT